MVCEEIMRRLNGELTDELYITDAYIPKTDFSDIAWASYDIEICTAGADASLAQKAWELLTTSPLCMTKKTKSGEKEMDIIPLINSVDAAFDERKGTLKLSCVLSASSTEYLNPEMLVTAMKQNLSIMSGDPTAEWYTIMRTGLYTKDMVDFK